MDSVFRDIHYALRSFRTNPGFAAIAILTLGLGIGGNTAIFSVVSGVLLRPLPYAESDRVVVVWEDHRSNESPRLSVSYPNFVDLRDESGAFAAMAAQLTTALTLTGGDRPDLLRGAMVSGGFFDVLGRRPALGRGFTEAEVRDDAGVIVLSHGLWSRRFGADPGIVGRSLTLNDRSYRVIGVMPEGVDVPLQFRDPVRSAEAWVPLQLPPRWDARDAAVLQVIGRLKPGATLERARTEMAGIARSLAERYPETNADVGVELVPGRKQVVGPVRPALLLLLGAVGFVLLIATANLANLMLGRALGRRREIAVRRALGASRGRLTRQLLTESVVLAVLGGLAGLALASGGLEALLAIAPSDVPRLDQVSLDHRTLGFTAAVSILAGLAFGLLPAMGASGLDVRNGLTTAGRGSVGEGSRLRAPAMVLQIALALVLLVGAGLLSRSFVRLQAVDPGVRTEDVLTLRVPLNASRYPEPTQRLGFWRELVRRLEARPGIRSAGGTSRIPLDPAYGRAAVTVEGRSVREGEEPIVGAQLVSPGYFRTLGIPLLDGRPFDAGDDLDAPPVLAVNRSMARRFWPNESAVGKRVALGRGQRRGPWSEIVAVYEDVALDDVSAAAREELYIPMGQSPPAGFNLVVRAEGDPGAALPVVRAELDALDPDVPIIEPRPMAQLVERSLGEPRFLLLLVGVFSGFAVLVAAVGLYGVIAGSVTRRTGEIGVRIALGAEPGDVLRWIVGRGVRLTLIGLALGAVAALGFVRTLEGRLFEVQPTDPIAFVGAAVLLGLVSVLASYVPARRATRIDPVSALRSE